MCTGLVVDRLWLVLELGMSLGVAMGTELGAGMCLGLRLDLSSGQDGVGEWGRSLGDVGFSTGLQEGG